MFENLRRDAAQYAPRGGWLDHPGFWITAVYRFGTWAHSLSSPFLRVPLRILYRIARLPLHLFNVDLWAGARGARIGPGLCLIHPRNIVIGAGVQVGENCLIFHEVTLGSGTVPGRPKIGNNVDIYVGARILGGVTIGDGCMIGANCVVTTDVPPNSVVVAPPSRILPKALSAKARGAKSATATESSMADRHQEPS
jgi:serine O-acetyltransferase